MTAQTSNVTPAGDYDVNHRGGAAMATVMREPPIWLLAAMACAATASYALPLMLAATVWAVWRGKIDLAGRFDAIEWSLILVSITWMGCSFAGVDPGRSLGLSIPMLVALITVFVVRRQRHHEMSLALLDGALFALGVWQCVQVAVVLLEGFVGEAAIAQSGAVWLVEPNDIAWICFTWPPMISRMTRGGVYLTIPIALGIVLMVALGSRLGLAAAVIALIPMLARAPRKAIAVALALACLVGLVALLIDPGIYAKGLESFDARLQLWHAAAQAFIDWPWTGSGPHNFELVSPHYLQSVLRVDPRSTPWPHSLPLELASGTGVAGILAVYLLGCAVLLRFTLGPSIDHASRRVLLAQLAAFLVLAVFEASFLRIWVWMIAAQIVCRLPKDPPHIVRQHHHGERK